MDISIVQDGWRQGSFTLWSNTVMVICFVAVAAFLLGIFIVMYRDLRKEHASRRWSLCVPLASTILLASLVSAFFLPFGISEPGTITAPDEPSALTFHHWHRANDIPVKPDSELYSKRFNSALFWTHGLKLESKLSDTLGYYSKSGSSDVYLCRMNKTSQTTTTAHFDVTCSATTMKPAR